MFAIGESRESSHANVTEPQAQVARNPRWGRFTTKTLQQQRRLVIQREQRRRRRQQETAAQREHRLA